MDQRKSESGRHESGRNVSATKGYRGHIAKARGRITNPPSEADGGFCSKFPSNFYRGQRGRHNLRNDRQAGHGKKKKDIENMIKDMWIE